MNEQEKTTIGNIQRLLQEQGKSKKDLCAYIGVSATNFGNWVAGRNVSFMKYTHKIAEYFNISVDCLLNFEQKENAPLYEEQSNVQGVYTQNIHMIPVFESVSAGFGTMPIDYIIDYEACYISSPSEAKDTICIKVKGDSMYPKIEDNDLIQVHKQDCVDSGSIAVIMLDNEEALVKKVVFGENWLELHSINPMYKTMRFNGTDTKRVQVLGLVKKIIKIC